jgi:hypothetical protein
LILLLRRGR